MDRAERKALIASIVEPYLDAKKDSTMLGVYKRIKPARKDGKIRTALSNVTTETSRLASSATFLYPHSTNLQNLPKLMAMIDELYQVRDCIIADPGFKLCAFDYDKAEMVAVSCYMKDWTYYEKLITGADVHRELAAQVGGIKESEVSDSLRQMCKAVVYASNYLATVPTVTRTINANSDLTGVRVTEKQVAKIQGVYFDAHPLKAWWQEVERDLKARGYLTNALGFKRYFFNPNPHDRHKEGCAFLPQSTVAQLINRSMTKIYNELDRDGEVELLMQVHDELLFQIREDLIAETAPKIRDIMQEPFHIHGREVYIPTGGKVGDSWGKMKDI